MYEYDAKFHSFVFECCEELLPESNDFDSTDEVMQLKLQCLCSLLTSYIERNKDGLAEMKVSTVFCRTFRMSIVN